MVLTSKSFGYKTLGSFYIIAKIFGLLLVREVDNKVACFKKNPKDERSCNTAATNKTAAEPFTPDARYLAYSAIVLVWFYWTLRRCMTLIGGSDDGQPCSDAAGCSSAIEWIVSTANAAQAMAAVAVAAAYRRASAAELLNHMHAVLARGVAAGRRSHRAVAATYAVVAATTVAVRSAAVVTARPDRFTVGDVLLLCVPAACVPVAVECIVVSACVVAENACRDVVDRLDRLGTECAAAAATTQEAAAARRRPAVHWQLEALWRDHWRGCRLVGLLSKCHGLDLAIDLTANMLFFIVYAYFTLMSVYLSSSASADAVPELLWNVALVCQLTGVSFRIVFISYRAEKIKQVAEHSVLISLRNLLKNNDLDYSTVMLINSFTYQITNRELKLSACGFFFINLSFFHALVRLATTYLIVIIQYNPKSLQTLPKSG